MSGLYPPDSLLLTYRSEEGHPALLQFLAGLDRERLTTEIEEMLKSLVASREIMYGDGKWERKSRESETAQGISLPNHPHLPRSTLLAVQQRLNHLSVEARDVLSFAAVVGRRFDFALLQHLSGRNEVDLVRLVKELITAQLVVEESEDVLASRHALTRQAAYTDLLARERRSLHHSVAQTMERIYANELDSHLGDLAYHFYMAGEWTKTLEYAQRAGEKAQVLYAPRAALEQYTHALEAAQRLSQTPISELYRARGKCYEMLGYFTAARDDYVQAEDYLQRALTLARSMNDPIILARTLNRVGNWHMNLEEPLKGQQYHREAFALARTIIQELASTVADEELRAVFLRNASTQLPPLSQPSPRHVAKQAFGGLTEREVAVLIAKGKSSHAIADELIVSERTIEKHVERIMLRLGFTSRIQIATWVVEKGLLNPSL